MVEVVVMVEVVAVEVAVVAVVVVAVVGRIVVVVEDLLVIARVVVVKRAVVSVVAQSTVSGHCFADGLVLGSQLDVLHFTAPGVPDNPNPTPHLVSHPLASSCIQLPEARGKQVCSGHQGAK